VIKLSNPFSREDNLAGTRELSLKTLATVLVEIESALNVLEDRQKRLDDTLGRNKDTLAEVYNAVSSDEEAPKTGKPYSENPQFAKGHAVTPHDCEEWSREDTIGYYQLAVLIQLECKIPLNEGEHRRRWTRKYLGGEESPIDCFDKELLHKALDILYQMPTP
jgi:hypothetical protein